MDTSQAFTINPDDLPTFEKAWALVMEMRKQQEATDRQIKETDRHLKETERQLNRRLGEFTNRLGEVVEYMVVPNLPGKFRDLGFTFIKAHQHTRIADRENNIFAEVDVFLENGDHVMIVEVKTTLAVKDVDEHAERMEKLRGHADLRNDRRKYLGALAGRLPATR
jgi:hypothetical protein